jgi:hypothetical protein
MRPSNAGNIFHLKKLIKRTTRAAITISNGDIHSGTAGSRNFPFEAEMETALGTFFLNDYMVRHF